METKKIYINDYFFTHLEANSRVGDRPEFHRHHEWNLWVIHQVLKAGGNKVTIVNTETSDRKEISDAAEFQVWVAEIYPGFEKQLDNKVYTSHPHPSDKMIH